MVDILGPADSIGAITTRPADPRTFGAADTFFQDCSTPEAEDGTDITAGFLNGIVAGLRALWRANGKLPDGVTPVVSETTAGDNGLAYAVQYLIQRGLPNFTPDAGTANNLVVSLSPTPADKAGLVVRTIVANAITGASQMNVGFGNRPIVHSDGSATVQGDMSIGTAAEFLYDGTSFQIIGSNGRPPNMLIAARDYYVNGTTGSDTNDGRTPATAFRTINKGVATVGTLELNGYTATVHVADGTYSESVQLSTVSQNGTAVLAGNDINWQNVFVAPTAGSGIITANAGSNWTVHGFKVSGAAQPGDAGNGIWVTASGRSISYYNIEFAAVPASQVLVTRGSALCFGAVRVSGGAVSHVTADGGSFGSDAAHPFTLSGTPNYSYFICATGGGATSFVASFSGAATGSKYFATMNGVISSVGNGVNYYPGNSAGTFNTGGQYA